MNEILLEYYAGKPKELIKCEGYLREIIKLIKKDHENPFDLFRSRNAYREAEPCRKLEQELAKFFNVKEVRIWWDGGMNNAYTYPSHSLMIPSYKNNLLNGRYSDFKINIWVFEDVVYTSNLNEQELMGLILHEIGHNFYYCPIMVGFELFYSVATFPIGVLTSLIQKYINIGLSHLENFLKKEIPALRNVVDLYTDVVNNVRSLIGPFDLASKVLTVLAGEGQFIKRNPIQGFYNYGNEKGADSFAAKYGYGPEVISGIKKMEHPDEYLGTKLNRSLGPIGAVMADMYDLTIDCIAMMIMDPHPNTHQRAQSNLAKLKADYAKGEYPPGMKKDLEFEIKRMEKMVDTVSNSSVQGDVNIKKCWYTVIDTVTNGHSDFRELFNFYYDGFRF